MISRECRIRRCFSRIWAITAVAVAGAAILFGMASAIDLLARKAHGFAIEGLSVEQTPSSSSQHILQGYDFAWLRRQRFGSISSNVEIAWSRGSSRGTVSVRLPYRFAAPEDLQVASEVLGCALQSVESVRASAANVSADAEAILVASIAREGGSSTHEGPRLGGIGETTYYYQPVGGLKWGAALALDLIVLVVAGRLFFIGYLASRGLRRPSSSLAILPIAILGLAMSLNMLNPDKTDPEARAGDWLILFAFGITLVGSMVYWLLLLQEPVKSVERETN
jgi:hypothetical protein